MQSMTVMVDRIEYCRYVPGMDKVTANVAFTGALAGDQVTVSLNRMDDYGQVTSQTVTVATNGQPNATVIFDLNAPKDTWGINRAVQGSYTVSATSGTVTATSPVFYVTVVPTDEMRQRWCFGIPLMASEILGVLQQPQVIAGVTVIGVAQYTKRGVHTLSMTVNAGSYQLSFDNGQPAMIQTGQIGTYTLVDQLQASYITVQVNPALLPQTSQTEAIVVDSQPVTDDVIRQYVQQAYGWIENKMWFPLEPRYVDTDNYDVWANHSDVLYYDGKIQNYAFTSVDPKLNVVERPAIPKTYYRPKDFMRWMEISLPVPRMIQLHILAGFFNRTIVLNVTPDWFVWNEMSAETDLVPKSGAIVTWQFFESAMLQFLYIYDDIPGFWHYRATCGLRDLHQDRQIIRELVAKKAAVDLLAMAGLAYSGGTSSRSTTRDGVTGNRSFETPFPGGNLVKQYQADISEQALNRIRNRFTGPSISIF